MDKTVDNNTHGYQEKEIESIINKLNKQVGSLEEIGYNERYIKHKRKKRLKRVKFWKLAVLQVSLTALMVIGLCYGYLRVTLEIMRETDKADAVILQEEEFDIDGLDKIDEYIQADTSQISWESTKYKGTVKSHGVINVLLMGEENVEDDLRGRADSIIIATLNTEAKEISLTSIMRDSYVRIPGHSENKINAAYQVGGIELLKETIELNYGLAVDKYVKVDFGAFEYIVDAVDGVDIKLSKEEAKYLRSTNYISKKKYRTVKAGMNHMNGNQALGYSRIRYVPTPNNLYYDYGRTYRQRYVLNQMFDAYKNATSFEIISLIPKIRDYVTTDMNSDEMIQYVSDVLTLGIKDINQYRLPIDGTYTEARVGTMLALVIDDFDANRDYLYSKLYKGVDIGEYTNN